MKNITKKQRMEALTKEGWTYTNFDMGIKDVQVTSEHVKETYEAYQMNGFNTKKQGFYFTEGEKAFCYKACGEYYTLNK